MIAAPAQLLPQIAEGFRIQRSHQADLSGDGRARRVRNAEAAATLARRLRDGNPGYARLWAAADTAAGTIPVLEKAFLARHFDEFAAGLTVTAAGAAAFAAAPFVLGSRYDTDHVVFSSSGSSGQPLPVIYTLPDLGRSLAALLDRAVLADRSDAQSLLYIGLMDRHNGGNAWMYYLGGALSTRLADIFTSTEELLQEVLRTSPDVILTRPHILLALGELAATRGVALPRAHLLSVGESLGTEQVAGITRSWGASPHNSYSTVETGPLGYQDDPRREELALYDDLHHVELVDATGRPVETTGIPGRVVVTTLYKTALPLVRYRVGDVAAWADASLSRITFPLGRDTRELDLRTADGRSWLPELELWTLRIDGLRQYQIVQTAPATLLVRCELAGQAEWPDLARRVRDTVAARVRHATGLGVSVDCERVRALVPDVASGKIQRIIPLFPGCQGPVSGLSLKPPAES